MVKVVDMREALQQVREKAPNTADAMKRYKSGNAGFTDKAHLKAKGLIPRADGTKKKSPKYEGLSEKKAAQYRNKFLGFVFQSFNLINFKNALENVALPLYYQGLNRKERQQKAMFHLQKVGLADWSSHLPNELSGGQKQRVAIARALASNPKLILADEPTGALDSTTSQEIMKFLQKLNDEGKTILIVTHEEDISLMCKRIVRLKDGVITEDKKIKQNKL